jgi:hypothetical protein
MLFSDANVRSFSADEWHRKHTNPYPAFGYWNGLSKFIEFDGLLPFHTSAQNHPSKDAFEFLIMMVQSFEHPRAFSAIP